MSDITDETISGAEEDQLVRGDLYVRGVVKSKKGVQSGSTEVTATADGLTTGLILEGTGFVAVTSADANHIITLPSIEADMIGNNIRGYIGATGCEIRTPATSNQKINDVDSDSSEAAIPSTTFFELTCVSATQWILRAWTELGAPITAIIPD